MPCRDELADQQSRQETVTNLHERTRMLCGLCSEIERRFPNELASGDIFYKVPGLLQWWSKHKKADQRRKAEEENQRIMAIAEKKDKITQLQREIDELQK